MKNLWSYMPPFLADTFGLEEVVSNTDGMGIIDDSTEYRSKSHAVRMVASHIRSEDVVGGTREKVLSAFRTGSNQLGPRFVLLCAAPCASMIGTDLGEIAEQITRESGLPAAAVEVTGHKTWENGVARSLEALAKTVVAQPEGAPSGVNLIGGSALNWGSGNLEAVDRWAQQSCGPILSRWGGRETLSNLQRAANTRCNLVTSVAGLRAAKALQSAYGTPYVAGAPFGAAWSQRLAQAVQDGTAPELPRNGADAPEVLIVAEQYMANAIRATLQLEYGMERVQVASFFTMDKARQLPGDVKLKSEEQLKTLLEQGGYKLVLTDENASALAPEGVKWVNLPCEASIAPSGTLPPLVGDQLNRWLDSVL
ncbi:MAG: nitrogenase component 1 [Clostridiales bacterium]|nr:nitrogenase component 1 [Clostridiales bacterium]